MVTVLRPLSTGELLDRTFHLYRNHFTMFLGISALPQLVVLALQLGLSFMILQRALTGLAGAIVIGAGTVFVIGFASYIAVEISHAATIMAVSHLHLERSTSIALAYSSAKSSMGRVIGISFAVAIGIGIGFLLLVIPGIYLALAWSLAIPVTVLEGGGLNATLNRSAHLTKGSRGRIFVIFLLIGVLAVVVSMVIQFGLLLPVGLLGIHDRASLAALEHALQAAGSFLSTSLVGSLGSIALTLVYYDLRVRKEGFDLQLMMSTLQPSEQTLSAATSSVP